MKWKMSLLLLLGFSFFLVACQADKPKVDMEEGLWEITTEVKMEGMPFQMPPVTHTQCITQEDLVPDTSQAEQTEQKCEVTNLKVKGNTVTYDLTCAGDDHKMTSHSSITYEKDRMQGSMTATMEPNNMTMGYTMTGRRIGDCPK
jgi:phage tail tube protein FII